MVVKWQLPVKKSMTANASRADACHEANIDTPAKPSIRKIRNEAIRIARTNTSIRLAPLQGTKQTNLSARARSADLKVGATSKGSLPSKLTSLATGRSGE